MHPRLMGRLELVTGYGVPYYRGAWGHIACQGCADLYGVRPDDGRGSWYHEGDGFTVNCDCCEKEV
jgi:hypothetical protein